MEERRQSKRAPFNAHITIESLFRSGDAQATPVSAPIHITNISKTGIGFIGEVELPKGEFFNTRITIDDDRSFFCVLKIVRKIHLNEGFQYGSEFVGMAEVLAYHIKDYVEEVDNG